MNIQQEFIKSILDESNSQQYHSWLNLRKNSINEYNEKLCYCGHTFKCECGDPDIKTFKESIYRGVLEPNNKNNNWIKYETR